MGHGMGESPQVEALSIAPGVRAFVPHNHDGTKWPSSQLTVRGCSYLSNYSLHSLLAS